MQKESVVQYFDRYAQSWDAHYKNSRLFKARYKVFEEKVNQYAAIGCNGLDYGCGTGILTSILQKVCARVYATDISDGMIQIAKNKFSSDKIVTVCNVNSVPHDFFNIAICSSVIDYVEDPDLFFDVLSSHLKRDGILLITFSNKHGLVQILNQYFFLRYFNKSYKFTLRFSKSVIKEISIRHGFEPIEIFTPIALPFFGRLGCGELYLLVARKI